ncbi:IclR family transcriptional regulator [Actinoplanes sp. NEAU-A12]|uniref:IclR family transcriptional regulator n=1 Tax=Actinoplanes sandaracinus TaxID=3045177 RepID=A0ABT6WPI5_9ACTN|nr:IclR family transcriptional regulator [Actinoplanes sandaracinus]MDI6101655.1 IclR family transcriptional regulator [Actinoplanes sandaracinus]
MTSRVLALLGAFGAEHRHLSLTQISRRAGLPLATAHRLTAELTAWGALERDSDGRYRIGLRLWEVGSLAPRGLGLREAALPFLEDLYEATHQNIQLAVLDGNEVVYVERIPGRDSVSVLTRVGGRWPAHATGVGLALLAHASRDDQERYLAGPLARFTPRTITEPARLRRELAEVRRLGYAVSNGQVTLDALSVAAPVRGPDGEVVAAISIVTRAGAGPPSALAPAVCTASRGLSRALRGSSGAAVAGGHEAASSTQRKVRSAVGPGRTTV